MAITDEPNFDDATQTNRLSRGTCGVERGTCRVHGAQFASMQASHAAEVASLRRRIEALEASLAQAEAARVATSPVSDRPPVTSIDIHATDRRKTDQAGDLHGDDLHKKLSANVSNITTGAAAWDDEDVTFSERIAALAFFREDDSDEPSRRWFLRNS